MNYSLSATTPTRMRDNQLSGDINWKVRIPAKTELLTVDHTTTLLSDDMIIALTNADFEIATGRKSRSFDALISIDLLSINKPFDVCSNLWKSDSLVVYLRIDTDSSTWLPSAQQIQQVPEIVTAEVNRLFSLAIFIDLEPGMENDFSVGLEEVIEKYGEPALRAIERLILTEKTKSSIAMEALQYIGDTDSVKWRDERRKMLEHCLLESRSAWVRDGAGLGLASLDDPRSIPKLEEAISNTTCKALREDLTLVLDQLKDTLLEL